MYDKEQVTRFKSRNKVQHNQPAKAPRQNFGQRQKQRKYIEPEPAQRCIVQDRWGNNLIYATVDDWHKQVLALAPLHSPADIFPSRRQAKKAISHTIDWLKSQGLEWHKDDWQIVEL